MIFGYLNLKTVELNLNGEILGLGFGIFSLISSGLILSGLVLVTFAVDLL